MSSFPASIVRECAICGEVRGCKLGGYNSSGNAWYRNKCNDCHNAYLRNNRKGKADIRTTQSLNRKMIRKQKAVDYLGGRCKDCGYDRCIKALNFHHRDEKEKGFTISQYLDASWAKLQPELDKCDLLCFNCHMERHCDLDLGVRPARDATCDHHEEEFDGATF